MIKQTRLVSALFVVGTMTLCTASAQASMFSNIQKAVKNAQAQQLARTTTFRNPSVVALNPQPLPPLAKFRPGSINALNPQPLPPLAKFTAVRH